MTNKVVTQASEKGSEKSAPVVAKAEDKKVEVAKPEAATDGGTPAPAKKSGGKK
jgi:hypothetical protein